MSKITTVFIRIADHLLRLQAYASFRALRSAESRETCSLRFVKYLSYYFKQKLHIFMKSMFCFLSIPTVWWAADEKIDVLRF
jgi:hypothetical protein